MSIAPIAGDEMRARVDEVLNHCRPPAWRSGWSAIDRWRGFTGTASPTSSRARRSMRTPVFRIASISKTITAIAVTQLWEQALSSPTPADDYLAGTRWCPPRPALGR